MTRYQLLAALDAAGVSLFVRDGELRYQPKELMTPRLYAALKEHKTGILTMPHCRACGQLPLRTRESQVSGVCLRCLSDSEYTAAVKAMGARRRAERDDNHVDDRAEA